MDIIIQLLEIKHDLTPTISQDHMIIAFFNLALSCERSTDLEKVADKILAHLQVSNVENKFPMMVQLVWKVNQILGCEQALELAKSFNLFKTLTQIAYQSNNQNHYDKIHEIVDNGLYKLEWAMRTVYEQDKISVENAIRSN